MENILIDICKHLNDYKITGEISDELWDYSNKEVANVIIDMIQKDTGKTIKEIILTDKYKWNVPGDDRIKWVLQDSNKEIIRGAFGKELVKRLKEEIEGEAYAKNNERQNGKTI